MLPSSVVRPWRRVNWTFISRSVGRWNSNIFLLFSIPRCIVEWGCPPAAASEESKHRVGDAEEQIARGTGGRWHRWCGRRQRIRFRTTGHCTRPTPTTHRHPGHHHQEPTGTNDSLSQFHGIRQQQGERTEWGNVLQSNWLTNRPFTALRFISNSHSLRGEQQRQHLP